MGQYTDFLGLSATTGAFAAGVLLAGNKYRAQIQADIKPFEGILLGVFFMTAGAQLDPTVVINEWPTLFTGIFAFIAAKAGIVFFSGPTLGLTKGQAARVALTISGGGEFAFVLFQLAKDLGVLPSPLAKLLTASVIISMSLTPILAELGAYAGNYLDQTSPEHVEGTITSEEANELFNEIDTNNSGTIDLDELRDALVEKNFNYVAIAEVFNKFDTDGNGVISREEWKAGLDAGYLIDAIAMDPHIREADVAFRDDAIVICGYGEIGQSLCETLRKTRSIEYGGVVVFDLNPSRVAAGVLSGAPVVFGDAARVDLQRATGVTKPRAVIVTYASDNRRVDATLRLRNSLPEGTPIYAVEGASHVAPELLKAGATDVVSETAETVLRFASLLGAIPEPSQMKEIRENFLLTEQQSVGDFEESHGGLHRLQFLDLASEVGCTKAELDELYDEFVSIAGGMDTVPIAELKGMVMRMDPDGPSDGKSIERCMLFNDEDGAAELTFEEFVRSYWGMCPIDDAEVVDTLPMESSFINGTRT